MTEAQGHQQVSLGLDTFGDVTIGDDDAPLPSAQVLRDVVEQAVLADQVGVDAIGLGEHHRDDYAISAPDVVLAHVAARTERILLGTAVTVLSSDDPVRVHERFATLDALSRGRAEVTLGRQTHAYLAEAIRRGMADTDFARIYPDFEKIAKSAKIIKRKPGRR